MLITTQTKWSIGKTPQQIHNSSPQKCTLYLIWAHTVTYEIKLELAYFLLNKKQGVITRVITVCWRKFSSKTAWFLVQKWVYGLRLFTKLCHKPYVQSSFTGLRGRRLIAYRGWIGLTIQYPGQPSSSYVQVSLHEYLQVTRRLKWFVYIKSLMSQSDRQTNWNSKSHISRLLYTIVFILSTKKWKIIISSLNIKSLPRVWPVLRFIHHPSLLVALWTNWVIVLRQKCLN